MPTMIRTPGEADVLAISGARGTIKFDLEPAERDSYLNGFIVKPWGHEYRVYCDNLFDVWRLRLQAGQSTSMHGHLQKDTVLICLAGSGTTTFLDGTECPVEAGRYVYIGRGAFHRTEAGPDGHLDLIEVENPRNKFDLVRLGDHYGRHGKGYEPTATAHETLGPMKSIGSHIFYREHDLDRGHGFSVARLGASHLEDPNLRFVVMADIHHHLAGRISVLRPDDPEIQQQLGSLALLIHATPTR